MKGSTAFFLIVLVLSAVVLFMINRQAGPDVTGPSDAQVVVEDVQDPEEDRNALPDGFRKLLDRDAIAPIYEPVFESAADSTWADDVLVVGVAINGEAKAYPVGYLNRREMVIDTLGDVPILVSW